MKSSSVTENISLLCEKLWFELRIRQLLTANSLDWIYGNQFHENVCTNQATNDLLDHSFHW